MKALQSSAPTPALLQLAFSPPIRAALTAEVEDKLDPSGTNSTSEAAVAAKKLQAGDGVKIGSCGLPLYGGVTFKKVTEVFNPFVEDNIHVSTDNEIAKLIGKNRSSAKRGTRGSE